MRFIKKFLIFFDRESMHWHLKSSEQGYPLDVLSKENPEGEIVFDGCFAS